MTDAHHTVEAKSEELNGLKLAGGLLSTGALIALVGLALHPQPAPDVNGQIAKLSSKASLWTAVHWAIAAGVSLMTAAGLVILQARSRLTRHWWTLTTWSLALIATLAMSLNAVVEATAVKQAALAGSVPQFEVWESFAFGMALAIPVFALAFAVIAASEARSPAGMTPTPVASLAAVAGVISTIGGLLWFALEIRVAGLAWALSTMLLFIWILWFGLAIFRSSTREPDAG
ncbi:MAG: hypothetical protein R3191_07380 [Anaerolineales bacterium]|nr:hypothetical protein [Anaerolineales bacterium]